MYNNGPDNRTQGDACCPAPPDRSPPVHYSLPPPAGGHHTGAAARNLPSALHPLFAPSPVHSPHLFPGYPIRPLPVASPPPASRSTDHPPSPNSSTPRRLPCLPVSDNSRSAGSPHRNSSTRPDVRPSHSTT